MHLNSAARLTYRTTTASTVASSRYVRPVFARSATDVGFPPQVAIVGPVSKHLRLVEPLTLNFEHDEAGKIIVSDDIFYMYGEGITRQGALRDYISSLVEYYELLDAQNDAPSEQLLIYLQSYLQPI